MRKHDDEGRWAAGRGLIVSIALAGAAVAQTPATSGTKLQTVPDAQIESNVLKTLAAKSELAGQPISTSTVYGVVTLTGSVPDEQTRTLAEDVVSRTAGVTKVVDEMTIGQAARSAQAEAPVASPAQNGQEQDSNPLLQSDGTMASPNGADNTAQIGTPASPDGTQAPTPDANAQLPPQTPSGAPGQGPYGQQTRPPAGAGPYGGVPDQAYGGYPPVPRTYPQGTYAERADGQPAGVSVPVPAGTTLMVRIDGGIDSKQAVPGSVWTGTVVRDVVAGGYVAIPRGAQVQGTVVDSRGSGALGGHADLALQVTGLTLGGSTFPVNSTIWDRQGGNKTARTVNSALGFGAVGAILGGVAGGGAGAAIGAGVGGAVGLGASAATGSTRILLPPEAVLSFQLAEPATLVTVSQAEMARLAGAQPLYGRPVVRRRYAVPPPYYGYAYGPPVYYAPYGPRYYRGYPY